MSAFQIIPVVVVSRVTGGKDDNGDYISADVPVPGSPFEARLYRSRPAFQRQEGQAGAQTFDQGRVMSFLDPVAAAVIEEGLIAIVPPCEATGQRSETYRIEHVRRYGNSVQCDLANPTPVRK